MKDMENIKPRVMALRLRTIVLTAVIIITLGFYLCVNAIIKSMDLIDFAILAFIQIVTHCLYFPDGEIYGSKNEKLVKNRTIYNEKATLVNSKMQFNELKEYTKVDFETRQRSYIETKCGYIGITYEDYEEIKNVYSLNDIKKADRLEFNGKVLFLSRYKRKVLIAILFKELPVGYNDPETILSALDTDRTHKITDKSRSYKIQAYIRKIFMAIVVGGVMAYIGYTTKDKFGLDDVVRMLMYLTSILTTAILSYSSGEVCQRVYKCEFYIELALFLDNFFEWLFRNEEIDIQNITLKEIMEMQKKKKESLSIETS